MRITLLLMLVSSISLCMHNCRYGVTQARGSRPTMEDAHYVELKEQYAFFGLYDGHGGSVVAEYAAKHLHNHCNLATFDCESVDKDADLSEPIKNNLNEGFLKTHKALDGTWFKAEHTGCTAIVAFIYRNLLTVANAGDSRVVLSRKGNAVALSEDHKPDRSDEKERIEKAGGSVTQSDPGDVWRVQRYLAVSRALGDKAYNPYVIPDPEIKQESLGAEDEFLIIACDGVWDVITNQEAVDIVKKAFADKPHDCLNAADVLKDKALEKESDDNISVIIAEIMLSK